MRRDGGRCELREEAVEVRSCASVAAMSRSASPAAAKEASEPSHPGAEPTLEGAFAPDGVDLTLIRWMLKRTPAERLEAAQDLIDSVWALRSVDQT